jgi:uncharacterized protein YjiS (DUF1127 family)
MEKPMSAHPTSASFVAQFSHAFGWPARALEARRARASLAELSERELRDIGGARDEYELSVAETPAEREARRLAVRAWYGHYSRAA